MGGAVIADIFNERARALGLGDRGGRNHGGQKLGRCRPQRSFDSGRQLQPGRRHAPLRNEIAGGDTHFRADIVERGAKPVCRYVVKQVECGPPYLGRDIIQGTGNDISMSGGRATPDGGIPHLPVLVGGKDQQKCSRSGSMGICQCRCDAFARKR